MQLLLSIDFFIAFYISFPFLIAALEIASSSIVADGACLKKNKPRKGLGNRNKLDGERIEWLPRRILFRDQVKRKEFLVRAFLCGFCFPQPKDKKLSPSTDTAKIIFNELKAHSCSNSRQEMTRAKKNRFSRKK